MWCQMIDWHKSKMGLQSVKLKSWHAYSEKKGTLKEDERLAERFPWRVIGVAR